MHTFLECKCLDFIDLDGYGNCLKRDARFGRTINGNKIVSPYSCYVDGASHCKDKLYVDDSGTLKTMSALACLNSKYNLYPTLLY